VGSVVAPAVTPSLAALSPVRSPMRPLAAVASPALPGVTAVAVMISLSGSTATWPL